MATLTMPSIVIAFQSKAASAIGRSQKGTVAVIVRDKGDGLSGTSYKLSRNTQIPDALGEDNQSYLERAFIGYITPPKNVLGFVINDTDHDLDDALNYFSTQSFDYLVGPLDTTPEEAQKIANWCKSQRTNSHQPIRVVLPNLPADNMAVINFTASGMTNGTVVWTTPAFCSRIAGLLAGTPSSISATYAKLPELTDVTRLDQDALNEAVGNGEFVLWHDGKSVKTGRAVNSLTTTTANMSDAFKKIKIVECLDMIDNDIRTTVQDDYIGKYPNNYDNKLILITAISGYLRQLELDNLIDTGWTVGIDVDAQEAYLQSIGTDTSEMTEQEIKEANTGSYVFLLAKIKPLDAIEDVNLNFSI